MPPAEKATIARIGLVGQACAHASPLARPRTDSNMKQIRVMPFSLVSRQALRGRSAKAAIPVLPILRIAHHGYGRPLNCGISIFCRRRSCAGEGPDPRERLVDHLPWLPLSKAARNDSL